MARTRCNKSTHIQRSRCSLVAIPGNVGNVRGRNYPTYLVSELVMRYRILYNDASGNHFRDIESNSLAHAIWELGTELCSGKLVDTMLLPSKENSHSQPVHVNLYPEWEKNNDWYFNIHSTSNSGIHINHRSYVDVESITKTPPITDRRGFLYLATLFFR